MSENSTTQTSSSFPAQIREELVRVMPSARHCRAAELSGIIDGLGVRVGADGAAYIRTDRAQAANKAAELIGRLAGADPALHTERGRTRERSILFLPEVPEIAQIRGADSFDEEIRGRECCCRAWLRGAFLATGTVSDPDRSYHLEFVCADEARAQRVASVLEALGVRFRRTRRKEAEVLYIKEGDEIANTLALMGSRIGLMTMENARILRDVRGSINRKVNCEAANINKAINAAVRQIEDIELIDRTMGLDALPNGLDEMARVRLQYPELTLAELGDMLDPPVGKSGVNHRLRKISAIADRLRN